MAVKKKPKENQNIKWIEQRKKVTVIGDSMLNTIDEGGLSNKQILTKERNHPGAASVDIIDYLRPVIRKQPNVLILSCLS